MIQKEIDSRRRLLKLELQGVNQLINNFFCRPQLIIDSQIENFCNINCSSLKKHIDSQISELIERKKELCYLINNLDANPFCNYMP